MNGSNSNPHAAFRAVAKTSVIYVMEQATLYGYSDQAPAWCNLGQGQPESGPLTYHSKRIQSMNITVSGSEYASIEGLWGLGDQIADFNNQLYRQVKNSLQSKSI